MRKALLIVLLVLTTHTASAEEFFGITPAAGAIGDGRLTAQVGLDGTIMCLRWPNATFYEHIRHRTGKWSDDPAINAWLQPHFGAPENAGAFAGIRYADGAGTHMRWLRDGKKSFAYASERSNRLLATYIFDDIGVTVEEDTFNVPEQPGLIRAYRLTQAPAALHDFQVIVFMNPALRNEHGVYTPYDDTERDDEARFATFARPVIQTLVTALPKDISSSMRAEVAGLRQSAAPAADVDKYLLKNATLWGNGIYLMQSASVAWAGFQVGTDARLRAEGPQDAFADATDGTLSASPLADQFETTAMALPLTAGKTVAWYAAFATTYVDARSAIKTFRSQEPEAWEKASDEWWDTWLVGTRLPKAPKARAFALRALVSLRTGYDPESGAIVASTSCEPPYNVDWPRDGAFFQLVLELNGKHAEAAKHAHFYPQIQNRVKRLYGPPGSFPMNAFADFKPGGPIDFEIDQIGFVLWLYRTHAAFVSERSPGEAKQFLQDIAPSARLAADVLVTCDDKKSGLPCPANEDDNPAFTQSLHGAITAWLGLQSAVDIFTVLGDTQAVTKYSKRAESLGNAIRKNYAPAKDFAKGSNTGSLGWSFWPAEFWTPQETTEIAHARTLLTRVLDEGILSADPHETAYQTKATIALLTPPLRNAATQKTATAVHALFLDQLATPGTLHLAELASYADLDGDGKKEWANRVAAPHLWAQALLYLSLLEAEDTGVIAKRPIRKVRIDATASACTCQSGDTSPHAASVVLWVLILWAVRPSRFRGPQE